MSSGGGSEKHETLQLRLDVGHESVLLAEPRTTFPCAHTHRWTVFVRGHNESSIDPSLIQKVVFHLHDDFPNPKRVISNPPFEVTETGYGGFVIPIFILFAHSKREHYIEYDMNLKYAAQDKNKETKILEFKDPKPELRARLLRAGAEISTNKPAAKVQSSGSASSFQDLFGETLHLAVPSTSNEKPKLPAALPSIKRQSGSSPSPNGSSVKVKHVSGGKVAKTIPSSSSNTAIVSQALSPSESEKKRRKSKDVGRPSTSSKSGGKHASFAGLEADNHRSSNLEMNGTAQCLLDASKLPPFVSPLSDGAYGGAVFPSTSSAGRDEQRHGDGTDDPGEFKVKKSSSKSRLKDGEKPKNLSSSVMRNAKRLQNGAGSEEKVKRKKTKSDSGLDSDYSSGIPNAHSPGVANGQHSIGAHDPHGGGNSLFSPPDSVRSLDTLQESPASAASSTSAGSSSSSTGRVKRHNGCEEDHPTATLSSTNASSDQDRLRLLLLLQQKIMTIKEKEVAQRVADMISTHSSFELTTESLEFDLCTLDSELVQRLLQLFNLQV